MEVEVQVNQAASEVNSQPVSPKFCLARLECGRVTYNEGTAHAEV